MPPTCWFSCTGHTAVLPSAPRATSTEISRSTGSALPARRAPAACSSRQAAPVQPRLPVAGPCRHSRALPFSGCPGTTLAVPHAGPRRASITATPNRQAVIAESASRRRSCAMRTASAAGRGHLLRALPALPPDVLEFGGDRGHALAERSHRLPSIVGRNHDVVRRLCRRAAGIRDPAPALCSPSPARHAQTWAKLAATKAAEPGAGATSWRLFVGHDRRHQHRPRACRLLVTRNDSNCCASDLLAMASIATANRPAFAAPASPMAKVATGTPWASARSTAANLRRAGISTAPARRAPAPWSWPPACRAGGRHRRRQRDDHADAALGGVLGVARTCRPACGARPPWPRSSPQAVEHLHRVFHDVPVG